MTLPGARQARAWRLGDGRLRGNGDAYGSLARVLHWVTPVLLIGSFGLVWSLSFLPVGADRVEVVGLHRTIGLVVLVVTVGRLVWRLLDRRPRPVGPRPLRWAAASVHTMLYTNGGSL